METIKAYIEDEDKLKHKFIEITPDEYSMYFTFNEEITSNGKPDVLVLVEGYLKWDGCINWKTIGYNHFCDEGHLEELDAMFVKTWKLGKTYIKNWMN
jgi:hypothetical protein